MSSVFHYSVLLYNSSLLRTTIANGFRNFFPRRTGINIPHRELLVLSFTGMDGSSFWDDPDTVGRDRLRMKNAIFGDSLLSRTSNPISRSKFRKHLFVMYIDCVRHNNGIVMNKIPPGRK